VKFLAATALALNSAYHSGSRAIHECGWALLRQAAQFGAALVQHMVGRNGLRRLACPRRKVRSCGAGVFA
jgi:hypothetical protein